MANDGHRDSLATAFLAAPTPLAVLEPDGLCFRITAANASWTGLLGSNEAEFTTELARAGSDVRAAVAQSLELRMPRQSTLNGRQFSLRASPTANASGSPIVLQLTDVSLSQAEVDDRVHVQHLHDLVDNATALMYIKDLSGRYVMVNHEFTRRFGIPSEEIVGRTDRDLYPAATAVAYVENDARVLTTGVSMQTEEPYVELSGAEDPTRRWVSIKFPLVDLTGSAYALGAISTDITDRKRAEDAVSGARLDAERASRRKDEFLSRMSHELRTPLNAILGFAQMLRMQPLDATSIEQVDHIAQAGLHLLALVNDALDISWIEAGSPGLKLAPVLAIEPLHQALTMIRPLAVTRDIEVASDLHGAVDRWVVSDPQRLRQVFLNLLGNAVKFNRPEGLVRVSCRVHSGFLRYRITDTGPGLDDDEVEAVFAPFSRLQGADDIEGSGLGLNLSRRLVEQMGGAVGLEHSAPGEGSTFYVDVPLLASEGRPTAAKAFDSAVQALPQVGPATIVQIEDTVANRELVEAVVAAMGEIRMHSAPDGQSGLALIHQMRPDLVLLDLNLPDMSGVEVVRRLQHEIDQHDLKVIVLSADATPRRIAQLRTMGIAEYILKPIDVHKLASAISELLMP
ncbi:MAG: domain S-box protein [Marmoricola sp.]|nr:domain S-box protein [Marmoricola sp.]